MGKLGNGFKLNVHHGHLVLATEQSFKIIPYNGRINLGELFG